MKILLFVDKLFSGGAERIASILLNYLFEKHDITAIVFNNSQPTYTLNPKIKIQKIKIDSRLRILQPFERILKIYKIIKTNSPNLLISFMVGFNMYVLLANIFTRKKIIVSERTTIQRKQSLDRIFTRHLLYRLASKVVFVSKSDYTYAKWLKNRTFIYNPTIFPVISNFNNREKAVVATSSQRRWHVKGFDMLIQAWAKISPLHPDWKLQFVGSNNDNKISNMVKDFGLENQVEFLGWTDEIDKTLKNKSIYVLSSRNEGFPNSLIEAMSQGCACVAFDCKTGPNEIITDGVSGLLARNGDVDDLATKLQLLIEDVQLRQRLAAAAIEEVRRFDKAKIMRQWDDLIRLTVG